MTYQFVNKSLESGLYEPEGIYLSAPFAGKGLVLQRWAANPAYYARFKYNGIALHGHIGVDFGLPVETELLAVDQGRVMEISNEPHGFEHYLKIEHRWGESFYAHVGGVSIESGQMVARGEQIGYSADPIIGGMSTTPHLHFAIRVFPYNRFDGWGGFADPLPFMDPTNLQFSSELNDNAHFEPPPMVDEVQGMRRP